MGAALHLVISRDIHLRDVLEQCLAERGIKLKDSTLATLQTFHLEGRTVLFLKNRKNQSYCLIKRSQCGILLGNGSLRELPMTLSCLRAAGKSIPPILDCGAFDAIDVQYFGEDYAVLVESSFLLEKLR